MNYSDNLDSQSAILMSGLAASIWKCHVGVRLKAQAEGTEIGPLDNILME